MSVNNHIQHALNTLGFSSGPPSSLHELNKRYHMLALKHHPDKNMDSCGGDDADTPSEIDGERQMPSDDRFKEINDAHKKVKDYYFDNNNTETGNEYNAEDYNSIFNIFIKSLITKISKKTNTATDNITTIIQAILSKGIQSAVLLFRNMDKQSCIAIYDILSTNQELFSISHEIIEELNQVVESKIQNDVIIKLNPSLSDMLLDKVYVLNESGHSYYIPLWHNQLHFKYKSCEESVSVIEPDAELIVICEPEIPEHITIDENNNIYIHTDVNICELFKNQVISVIINDETHKHGFEYKLYARDVSFQSDKKQCIRLYGSNGLASLSNVSATYNRNDTTGLSGDNSMYDVSKRSNVYAIVKLVM
jgi:hypothetical protein